MIHYTSYYYYNMRTKIITYKAIWKKFMALNSHQRQFLKAQAHSLNPLVLLGNEGLSANVIKEIDSTIEHHELIKIRLNAGEGRKEQAKEAAEATHCELVDVIGRVAILFRQKKEGSRFILPKK